MSVELKVIEIIGTHLKVDPSKVTLKHNLRSDLDADSIDVVEIALLLESAFKISISTEETDTFVSVQNVVSHVINKTKA